MHTLEIIQKKRDKLELSPDEIRSVINLYVCGEVPDYQMSAFLMAIFLNGMTGRELSVLTEVMLQSGSKVTHDQVSGQLIDKHSTGGVGDKISIPLAPLVAACHVYVPMIAGRGLGHTGGTLDKLESIPGFRTNLSEEEYRSQTSRIGCCIMGQTSQIAPADKKIYALRDVSGTVESIPLIASSIMSKKLAEGVHGLVLDVKYGSGAFLQEVDRAKMLACTMVDIGLRMNKKVVARLTSMEEPLGRMVGNALEIKESLDILKGRGPTDSAELTLEFGAEMLLMANVCTSIQEGRKKIQAAMDNGKGLEKFAQMIEAQGGNPRIVDDENLLPKTQRVVPLRAKQTGFIEAIDTRAIGMASLLLGGGRQQLTDVINPAVGLEMLFGIGDYVQEGQDICVLHSANQGESEAIERIFRAIHFSKEPVSKPILFNERITNPL